MFGVLNIYKPCGITSHDVVGIIRKILKIKQVGHTGTLDPFAQGVLPVCVGKATRLIEYFDDEKEYVATVQFGASTTTYDIEGEINRKSDLKISKEDVLKGLEVFRGEIEQNPPIFSAIKVNGKKLYEYARNNEEVIIPPRKVVISKLELLSFDAQNQTAQIIIECSKGTYIRSIANDLGENLGCFAHLTKLVRTRAGKFAVENAINLPVSFSQSSGEGKLLKFEINEGASEFLTSNLINPAQVISFPKIELDEKMLRLVQTGSPLKHFTGDIKNIKKDYFLILLYNGEVKAVGQFDGCVIKVRKVFV